MSRGRETSGGDLLKSMEKPGNISFYWARKPFLGFLLSISFLFLFYSIFSTRFVWKCPRCIHSIRSDAHSSNSLHPTHRVDSKTDISHILFGIGGSVRTWPSRRHYSELWWRPGQTRGFVWLDEEPPQNATWSITSIPYRVSANSSQFPYTCTYGSRSAVRMARIVAETVALGLEGVRWVVMGDDDTVFFTENLVTVLGRYDHEEYYYIGGISESVEQDVIHTYGLAYGGGGYAISYGLAEELAHHLDGCLERYPSLYGSDERVRACLCELGVPLTRESGFHQVDLRGDAYGFLAAHPVTPLVSLHHLDAIRPIFPWGTQLDAMRALVSVSRADPGRTLQQTFCYDVRRNWTVSVSWGYTVQIYPWILTPRDLEKVLQTFQSWRTSGDGPFSFDTRPLASAPCYRPLLFFLEQVVDLGPGGGTHTVYSRHWGGPGAQECEAASYQQASMVGRVRVFANKTEPNHWYKAPRRQCSEIHDSLEMTPHSIQISIRPCKLGDSMTPPA